MQPHSGSNTSERVVCTSACAQGRCARVHERTGIACVRARSCVRDRSRSRGAYAYAWRCLSCLCPARAHTLYRAHDRAHACEKGQGQAWMRVIDPPRVAVVACNHRLCLGFTTVAHAPSAVGSVLGGDSRRFLQRVASRRRPLASATGSPLHVTQQKRQRGEHATQLQPCTRRERHMFNTLHCPDSGHKLLSNEPA